MSIKELLKHTLIAKLLCICCLLNSYAGEIYPVNSPYKKAQVKENTIFSNFSQQPKHLDPGRSYSSDEYLFIAQIYEPPFEYHYLLRPYQLSPLSAKSNFELEYRDLDDNKIELTDIDNVEKVAYSIYTINIKPNIYYQPHPAFIKNNKDEYLYHKLTAKQLKSLNNLEDFNYRNLDRNINSRELKADDFIYQIKRLADPKVQSPIYSLMGEYIVGLDGLNKLLFDKRQANKNAYINLNDFAIEGLRLVNDYRYQIKIKGRYPQFKYWLAMIFFSPLPWEADKFYSQDGLKRRNISLDTYPVGTGPYYLTENNPNRQMVLEKNPYYQHGFYPKVGMPGDQEKGLLKRTGQTLPFINKAVYNLEKESIPIWNKFLQGYYDFAGISSDNFDQAIEIINSKLGLSPEMQEKGINLVKTVEPSIFYWGFNMLDPVVGGYTEQSRKLRQAIAIAFDVEEYINIFRNGRGTIAHGPIPPGIGDIGSDESYNYYVYKNKENKKSIEKAKILLAQAGYKDGIDPKTQSPLVINYDAVSSGNPSDGALFNWMRKQFEKIDIKLNIRATQYNRFRDKMRTGQSQLYMWGWNADYPDPENFLFLFLCNQARVKHNGENSSNYCSSKFDQLFDNMQNATDDKLKRQYINEMIQILRHDSPWIFGLYNELFVLRQGWLDVSKPLAVGNNNMKYLSLNPHQRIKKQREWNQPMVWPLLLFIIMIVALILPVAIGYYKKTHRPRERV